LRIAVWVKLVSVDEKADVLRQLDIPWLRRPIDEVLESLFAELHQLWTAFDRDLRRGRLKRQYGRENTERTLAPNLARAYGADSVRFPRRDASYSEWEGRSKGAASTG
jgi:hypothetical protein